VKWPTHFNATHNTYTASFLLNVPVDDDDVITDDVIITVSGDVTTSTAALVVHECRYDTVVGGSFVAFMYPGHFVPLWVVMIIIYGQIYMRSRGHRLHTGRLLGTSSPGLSPGLGRTHTRNMYSQNVCRWSSTRARCDANAMVTSGCIPIGQRDHQDEGTPSIVTSSVTAGRWTLRSNENWRALRVLTVLVGYFMFSWLPVVIWYSTLYRGFTIEDVRRLDPVLPAWFYNVSITLAYGNSAVNPFLYGFGNRSIRRCLTQIVQPLGRRLLCRTRSRESAPTGPWPAITLPLTTITHRPRVVRLHGITMIQTGERCHIAHVDMNANAESPTAGLPGPPSVCRTSRTGAGCTSEIPLTDERRVIAVQLQRTSSV